MLQRGVTTVISCSVYVDIVKSKAASQLLSVSCFSHHLFLPLTYSNKQIVFKSFELSENKNMNANIKGGGEGGLSLMMLIHVD